MAGQRHHDTAEFKAKVAGAAIKGQQTVNEMATTYGVHPNQVLQWKKQALEALPEVFSTRRGRVVRDEEALQGRLYPQIGQLKGALDWRKTKAGLPTGTAAAMGRAASGMDQRAAASKVLPSVKTTRRSIEGGRCCHGFAVPVDACRRLIVQRLVQALVTVKRTIAPQAVDGVLHIPIIFHIHFFVLHTAPQPFDKDVVQGSAASIHADANPTCQQRLGKGQARALGSLIRVEAFWLRPDQRALKS